MKKAIVILMTFALAACAGMTRATPDARFEAYRAEVKAEQASGKISAVQEQEKLRDKYWQIFGKDADSAGHFAFTISLMGSAEAGNFPMEEARAMVAARESEIFALKMVTRQVASSYEFPPN